MRERFGKFIGNKTFYRHVFFVVVPIIVQNGITNFVNLLDNIMIGQVGTEEMSGVAIGNQLVFIFNLFIFGAVSGAGIFGAQFFGRKDLEGVRNTFRYKIIVCAMVCVGFVFTFLTYGEYLIGLYLHEDGTGSDLGKTLGFGTEYLHIMLIGLVAFAFIQIYASTLRESGDTALPMKAGIASVLVNLTLNYLLIFGNFGFEAMGVRGAAVATVIARMVELTIIVGVTHAKKARYQFIQGVYKTLKIPIPLVKMILVKGMPLMINEGVWVIGMATLIQCYSVRGLSVVAGLNIANTITNLFNIVAMSMGDAVAIMVGQQLGAGNKEKAKDLVRKLIFLAVASCAVVGCLLAIASPFIPLIYNTTREVQTLATKFILVSVCYMPIFALLHCCYFTLRSGGKTVITFLFDSVFVWVINIPCAYVLARYTGIGIVQVYLICQMSDIIKVFIGVTLVKKGIWLNSIIQKA